MVCCGKNTPVRNRYLNHKDVIVIPVFDFYDDLETADPLGLHSVIHKVGMKYTVIKAFQPMHNSKLENILLNMIINSSERAAGDVFDIYLDEMSELENKGFMLTVDEVRYTVCVVLVQVIGDNLGLNSMLGYVESFTANYPCRLCKLPRDKFGETLFEQECLLRTRESYDRDVLEQNPSETGIKSQCVYN